MHMLKNNVRLHLYRLAGGAIALATLVYLTLILGPQFQDRTLRRGAEGRSQLQEIQLQLFGINGSATFLKEPQILDHGESKLMKGSLGQPLPESEAGSRRSSYNDTTSRKSHGEAPPATQIPGRIDPSLLRKAVGELSQQSAPKSTLDPCRPDTFSKRPPDNLKESFVWQRISQDATNTYVFSAHYDSRGGRREVVIVGLSNDYVGLRVSYACQIWFADSDTAEVTSAVITTHSESHGLKYVATFYTCTLQHYESLPFAVSLVTSESRCRPPFNILRISPYDPSNSPEVNFTVCVTPLNYNYDDYRQLVEMVELNRMFGAQRVVFYNFTTGSHVDQYLRIYEEDGMIVVVPWKLPVLTDVLASKTEPEIHYFGQLAALNDCLYRNMFRSRFVVLTDLDEIVVPRKHGTWMEMVESQGQGLPSDWLSGIASFHIRNVFFRTDYGEDELYSGDARVRSLRLRSLLTTTREEKTFPHKWRSKHMVNTKTVLFVGVHHIESILDNGRSSVLNVDEDTALLHHYRSWAAAEGGRQPSRSDRYMHRFNQTILSRVVEVHNRVATRIKGMAELWELTTDRAQSVKL